MKAYNRAAEEKDAEARISSDPGQPTTAERYLWMAAHTYKHVWRDNDRYSD
jgi:hypothetical protein